MNNRFGLKEHCITDIVNVLKLQPEVEEAIIFGSRAMGTYKNGSDIDIALKGEKITFDTISTLRLRLDELPYLYMYDIIDYKKISNPAVTAHIDELGITFYKKQTMPSEWKTITLGEVCTDISYGYTESASTEIVGPKFLRITDIQQDFINWTNVPYCPITPENHNKYKLEIGDVVIARTGASTGATAIFKDKNIDAVFASYLIRYKIDKTVADPFYISHILRSPYWKSYVGSIIGGSAQPGANAKQFASFEFQLPSLPTQRQIAQILSSLDDKIELNLQMNQTLEAMAQTIFKEWFVDFNFPGFDGELVDGLPKGWRKGKLGDVTDVKGGTTPSTTVDEYWNGDNYWTTPKDLSNAQSPVLIDTERKITDLGVKQISSGVLPKGTLLLSSRAPIGYLAISQVPISINQGYIAIQGKAVSNLFMLFWLKENMEAVKSKANGSTFQEISKSNFKLIDISIPSVEVLQRFDEIIDPIFRKIVENVYSNLSLTQLRDTLLPKLMSGQLEVKK